MTNTDLLTTIHRVRRRWRLALVLRGAAICTVAALVLLALSAAGFARFGLSPESILWVRVAVAVAAIAILVVTVLMPMLRRVSDARVALYIEEREPALEAVLISAIDSSVPTDGALARAMVERAAAQCRELEYGKHIEEHRLRRNGVVLGAVAGVVLLIVAAGPPALRNAARTLVLSPPAAEAAMAMTIAVAPGSDTIARGSDFAINADLKGFSSEEAFVVLRAGEGEWQRWPMSEGRKAGSFESVLFDVAAATDYYIESNGVRSIVFRVDVVEAPYVSSIALEYAFPAYTGMAPRRVESGGDVVAPKGTRVRVIATASGPVERGRLRLDGSSIVAMQTSGDGTLQGSFSVVRDGLYHVELPDIDGRFTNASAQYAITAVQDEAPVVRIDKPGRDVKVSAVDEVFVSAGAEDDYGISALDLVYSVNGGAEQTKQLFRPSARSRDVTGAHTLFLEEMSLQPGDIVSYFARATDNNGVDGPRTTTTDIYFVQIRPYSRNYRAAEQAGQPGQPGQQDDPGALSERQRQIIAATFNIVRDRATFTPTGFAEAVTTIELSQKSLREQVATLVQRMQMRGVVEMDSMFAQIAKLLPQAGREMADAEERLKQRAPNDALAPEQRALQQLLRAEALYRDVQIQMQQQQSAAGGSGSSMPDDLADMFELERNQLRNQYEQIQRSRQEQRQEQVEKEIDRLKELAQRQQQEAERQSQAGAQQQQQQGQQQGAPGGGGGAQRRLADEAEQAARRLERLARENPSPEVSEAARALQEAAESMRRASAERGGRGQAEANAARERLEEARRRLQRSEQQSLEQQVNAERQRAEQLREQQNRIAAEAEQAGATPTPDQLRRLNQQRGEVGARVGELESRLDRLEAEARDNNERAARELGAAADAIRDSRLRERMRAAQGSAQSRSREFNRAQDAQINRDLERVTEQIARAQGAAGSQSREAQAESAAERARRLAQGIESMRDRVQQAEGEGEGEGQRQLGSEMRARAQELRELQGQLRGGGMGGRPLQDAVDAMNAASPAMAGRNPEQLDRLLAQVARGLEDLEFDLRQLVQTESREKLHTSGRGQVPAEYRKAVEEYYRSLSRKR